MKKNAGIIAILALIIVVVAAVGAASFNNNSNVHPISAKSTKLALYNNNPDAWLHMDLVAEGVTFKNGTTSNLYIEAFMEPAKLKPNGKIQPGTVTIDLSQLLGYGNEKLPAGTIIRILSWKGLYNPTAGGTSNLDLTMQGWSNTRFPGADDQVAPHKINIPYSDPLPIAQLPSNIKKSTFFWSTNPMDLEPLDDDADEPLFEEEMINRRSQWKGNHYPYHTTGTLQCHCPFSLKKYLLFLIFFI